MAGFTKTHARFSLIRSLIEETYAAPASRGAFSATRRTADSILSTEGRRITGSSSAVTFCGQSGATALAAGDSTPIYMIEFTVNALASTTGEFGIVGDTGDGTTTNYTGSGHANSATLPFVAGDVIALAFGVAGYYVFKNGLVAFSSSDASAATGAGPPFHFYAADDTADPGTFNVTAEPELDVMAYASSYVAYFGATPIVGWPTTAVAADGAPPAPAPGGGGGGTGPALFDSTRTPIGTLSGGDKIITSAATSGSKATAIGQGSVSFDPFATPVLGFAAEFTVGAVVPTSMCVAIVAGSATGSSGSPLFTDIRFNANGFYNIASGNNGTATAWSPGDKIGIVLYKTKVAFFRNGTHIAHGTMSGFDISAPYRFAVEATSDGVAVSMSVQCSVAAMTYGSTYAAFRDSTLNSGPPSFSSTMGDAIDWPSAGS